MNKYWECDYLENGYVSLIAEPDGWLGINEDGDMVYTMSEYPFQLPRVHLEGTIARWYPDRISTHKSVIVVDNGILTKYTKRNLMKLVNEEIKENISRDEYKTMPYEEWEHGMGTGDVCGDLGIDIEEIDLNTLVKRTYQVSLVETSTMRIQDYEELLDYVDPNIIKKIM
jgi:hypothetical protein